MAKQGINKRKVKTSEVVCCVCSAKAIAWWPVIDPDIPQQPYCRKCLNKIKLEIMIKTFK